MNKQKLTIAVFENFYQGVNKTVSWSAFAAAVTRSEEFENKPASVKRKAFVGGPLVKDNSSREDNVVERTVLTLDLDAIPEGTTLQDVEIAFVMSEVGGHAFAAHSTVRHTPEEPRIRVIIPLNRSVNEAEFIALSEWASNDLNLGRMDACSTVINQIMFFASHLTGVEPWAETAVDEPFLDVDAKLSQIGFDPNAGDDDDVDSDDMSLALADHPIDIDDEQVGRLLVALPASSCDYDRWKSIGMALWHQYRGSYVGFVLFNRWSGIDDSRYNESEMQKKWDSFDNSKGSLKPVTMRTLIKWVGPDVLQIGTEKEDGLTLGEQCQAVSNEQKYDAAKRRIKAYNTTQLPKDKREIYVKMIHTAWAKEQGVSIGSIREAVRPAQVLDGEILDDGRAPVPEWLEGWVYSENDCLFVNTTMSNYAIKREAFRAKFDRMPEPDEFDTDAAEFALNNAQIPTVVSGIFFPGEERFFEYDGRPVYNTYHESGIDPAKIPDAPLDPDGEAKGVATLLRHLENLVPEERERGLILDYLAYVYQNPLNKARWGLLFWGIEGNGKTYFYNLMSELMGDNVGGATTSMVESRFNNWCVNKRLIGIDEIRISGTSKYTILDKLKPMLSDKVVHVEPKGRSAFKAPNFANYILTTNYMDAVPVGDNDRRYCIIFTYHRRKEDLFAQHGGVDETTAYFDNLFSVTLGGAGLLGIARFLRDRDTTLNEDFTPQGRAPSTKGVEIMRDASTSDDKRDVMEAIAEYQCAVVNDEMLDVTYLASSAMMGVDGDPVVLPTKNALARILRDLGYEKSGLSGIGYLYHKRKKHSIWKKGNGTLTEKQMTKAFREFHADPFEGDVA